MPDMSRFVGIYVRMLDNNFACLIRLGNPAELPLLDAPGQIESERTSI
jgi:hypothetical protein